MFIQLCWMLVAGPLFKDDIISRGYSVWGQVALQFSPVVHLEESWWAPGTFSHTVTSYSHGKRFEFMKNPI